MRETETNMKLQTILILILAGALLLSLFFNFDQSEITRDLRKQYERKEVRIKAYQDSVREVIAERDARDLQAIKLIQDLTIKDQRHADQIKKLTQDHEKIRHFSTNSDKQRDSIRAELYPSSVGL